MTQIPAGIRKSDLVGGAVMCLVFEARASTRDVDAYFKPTAKLREAAKRVAREARLPGEWLNDAVKGYLSPKGSYAPYLDLSHLKVFVARPEYLIAMKCLALRIGEEFHDIEDVRYLLRYLNIASYTDACGIITKYYALEAFPQKTLYALDELLGA